MGGILVHVHPCLAPPLPDTLLRALPDDHDPPEGTALPPQLPCVRLKPDLDTSHEVVDDVLHPQRIQRIRREPKRQPHDQCAVPIVAPHALVGRLRHFPLDRPDHLVGRPPLRRPAGNPEVQAAHEPFRVEAGTSHHAILEPHERFDVSCLHIQEYLGHLKPLDPSARPPGPTAEHVAEPVPGFVPVSAQLGPLDRPGYRHLHVRPRLRFETGFPCLTDPVPLPQFTGQVAFLHVLQTVPRTGSGVEDLQPNPGRTFSHSHSTVPGGLWVTS